MASGIIAAAAVASAAVSVYSAVESKKEAKKQYEAQLAAFSNEIDSAITNAEWALVDKTQEYYTNKELQDTLFESSVDSLWDTLDNNVQFETTKANISNTLDVMMSQADINAMLGTTKANIAQTQAMTQIDVEYQLAMGNNSASVYTAKALSDSVEYLAAAEAGLQFLDADANTVMEEMRRMKEDMTIATDEAAGQVLVSTSNTVNSGGSSARKMQQTYIKADRMRQAKVQEQESALARVYGNMTKTAKETGARVSNALTTGAINAAKAKMDAITSSQRAIASGQATIENLQEMFSVNSNKVLATTIASIQATNATKNANISKTTNEALIQFDKYTDEYLANSKAEKDAYNYDQLITKRSLEQSLITGMNEGLEKDKYTRAAKLVEFYNNNQEYYQAKETYGWGAEDYQYIDRATKLMTDTNSVRQITDPSLTQYARPGQSKEVTNIFEPSQQQQAYAYSDSPWGNDVFIPLGINEEEVAKNLATYQQDQQDQQKQTEDLGE